MSEESKTPPMMPRGLIVKLCEVMAEAGYVQKRGHNEKFNYDYATEADVVDSLRDKLASRHVFVFPSVVQVERKEHSKTNSGATMFITDIMMKWTFIDGDTGETQDCLMPGCGTDTGDKSIYKAITGSSKYLFLKAFMLPTGDDPEDEAPEKEKRKKKDDALTSATDRTVTLTNRGENMIALSGKGWELMELDGKTKAALGFRWEGSVPLIEAKHGFEFVSLCEKHKVETIWMDSHTEKRQGPPKANMDPLPKDLPPLPSNGHDPIITKAERVSPKKPGGKPFLAVEWDGKKANCFSKFLWPHIEHHVGRPAVLTLKASGNYLNVEGIVSLDGQEFFTAPIGDEPELGY